MRFSAVVFALSTTLVVPVVSAFDAGAAKTEITPPVGTPLDGYIDRLGRESIDVHDPLWARSLYLSDGTEAVVIVSVDLCAIHRELRKRVLELLPAEIPSNQVILTATHTHSGQGGMCRNVLYRMKSGRFVPEVLESTAQGVAASIRTAFESRRRATIGYAVTNDETLSENRQNPEGAIDEQIGVIRVDDSDGNPIAIVANFAAHPTTVDGNFKFTVSADFPGAYCTATESAMGEGCVALFLNGATGNQRPANPDGLVEWSWTDSIGNRLAEIVLKSVESITCREAALHVGTSTPKLPSSIADAFMPEDTILHTLEIDRLILTFVPGEPCVEIGHELRRRTLARGYSAQFTIGLANDQLFYFVPRELYAVPSYESSMNMYGPSIDRWLYQEFEALMTRGKQVPGPSVPEPPEIEERAGIPVLRSNGSAYEIGYQRGLAFKETIQQSYERYIIDRCNDGTLVPETKWWAWSPPFLNLSALALPRLAIGTRAMLLGVSDDIIDELDGMSAGSGLPFDAAWLLQCLTILNGRGEKADLFGGPYCTVLSVTGDKAGADYVLAGRNFDWAVDDPVVVCDTRPTRGRRFMTVGLPWTVGAFSGMNEAGLVVCAEQVEMQGEPSLDGPPVEILLRDVLQHSGTVSDALAKLTVATHVRGFHVLIAGPGDVPARVIEFGNVVQVREPSNGYLLGIDPTSAVADNDSEVRYRRAARLLESDRIVAREEIKSILSDTEPGRMGREAILNSTTRYSVIFEPTSRRLYLSVPDEVGSAGEYIAFSLEKGRI